MSKILMLKGLPASGKSTYAKELVARGGWKRVNKDDLRAMIDASKWTKSNEKFVLAIRDLLIIKTLNENLSVVVDDTNFNPVHEANLQALADQWKVPFEVKFINTPVEECLERNIRRPNPVRETVIWQMYNQYLKPAAEVYVPPKGKPQAIVCDIDGTLAHGIHVTRKPYEWNKVSTDTLDDDIAEILEMYQQNHKIILLSGRDGSCRADTEQWLADRNIKYDELLMREAKDNRKDWIVKKEIFDAGVRDKYQVKFVLDDRDQVVEMWRRMGLKVFQVADGAF